MPLQATSGAASYDAFGGGVAAVPNYIEDVFSTYLYTGTGAAQSIVNGIDESGEGALTWIKNRSTASEHALFDTNRGVNKALQTQSTAAEFSYAGMLTAFNSNGFSLGTDGVGFVNVSGDNYASWTFRKQPKFFDVVTYTGTGSAQNISHNLGSAPACMFIKATNASGSWAVYHRSFPNPTVDYLILNATFSLSDLGPSTAYWNSTNPTSTQFTVGTNANVNASGTTYVAYLFAHDAGGFGLTGTDNVISCGSYTGNGSSTGPVIDLGYEPQWLLIKKADSATTNTGWAMFDNMRGLRNSGGVFLYANSSAAEDSSVNIVSALATGFQPVQSGFLTNGNGSTYIYIAIRRGPMKVPTSGTSVFSPQVQTPTGATNYVMAGSSGFPIDWLPTKQKDTVVDWYQTSRLTNNYMSPNTTAAEGAYTYGFDLMQGVSAQWNTNSTVSYAFRRAPNFFDVVCYTGTGSATTFSHNLGVAPEMMIVKGRTNTFSWFVYQKDLTSANESFLTLNTDSSATSGSAVWNSTSPTSSVFSVGSANAINQSGNTYVAYLFATCAGVSKVFSYTGNGSSQTINCGFTAGARWILIKRTDSTGDWYVWDSARGIVSGNDPHLSLNTTAAEVTTDDTIDTDSTGFVVNQVSATNVNVSSATYIGIAIA